MVSDLWSLIVTFTLRTVKTLNAQYWTGWTTDIPVSNTALAAATTLTRRNAAILLFQKELGEMAE